MGFSLIRRGYWRHYCLVRADDFDVANAVRKIATHCGV